MRFQRLIQAAAVGLLLGLAGPVFSQMEIREGKRHAGPGAVSQSASTFAVGVTRDNGLTFVSSAAISDAVEIRGQIRPEPENVNQPADIFVVDRWLDANGGHLGFRMRDQDGVWRTWTGSVSELVPFQENVPLNAVHEVTLFSGTLEIAGAHRIFLGYMAGDNILRYHTSGLPVTITEVSTQTPLEQAKALFESTIHPNIVQGNCISCHVPGDPLTGNVHQFTPGSGQAVIDANFQVFSGMIGRGKEYILGKVRGENGHLGGAALPRNFPGYADFETFLTLLEQR